MDEKKRMVELAGLDELGNPFKKKKPKTTMEKLAMLKPDEVKKLVKKYNRNLQRLTLTDSFEDAVVTALGYSIAVAGKTLKDVGDNEVKTYVEKLKSKFSFSDKDPVVSVSGIKAKIKAVEKKRRVNKTLSDIEDALDYDDWLNAKK
jgi:hypothetical protein